MLIQAKQSTSWFRLGIVIFATLVSFWVIKEALAKPFNEWQTYNEIRHTEIKTYIDE